MKALTVEPVPTPRTMPSRSQASAAAAARCFRSAAVDIMKCLQFQ
jgi:hypothetical protein